jgi:hypothetical protein
VIVSAVLTAVGGSVADELLPGLADGSVKGAVALAGSVTLAGGTASGNAGNVLGGGLADVLLVAVGDDVAVVKRGDGVKVDVPPNMDPTRRSARHLDGARPPCSPARRARRPRAYSSPPRQLASRGGDRDGGFTRRSACSSAARSRCSKP